MPVITVIYGFQKDSQICTFLHRRHKPGWGSGADLLTNPHHDPAPPGHEALPAVPHGDPPSAAQHEPLPQLQYGER